MTTQTSDAIDRTSVRTALAEAESSLLVHLELYSWLGDERAMAVAYRDLADLYREIGDPEPAAVMIEEAGRLESGFRTA